MENFSDVMQCFDMPEQAYKLPPLKSLTQKKLKLETQLSKVNDAIQFLKENPTFEKGLTLMQQAL